MEKKKPEFIRVPEVAERFSVSDGTVYQWIQRKILPAVRIGGTYYVRPEAIAKMIADGETK